uniref:PMS1 n=1 Tax=Allium cepa TaxID=4679 RepID=A0A6B9KHL4_ALLCE|nr:PMS1 [Allium cepa]
MNEEIASSPTIKPINKSVVHRICSGQVILDLQSAVKELLENSLDAGATCIEINLKEHGEEYFKVVDNGSGISPDNFQNLARKHHTSKIADFSDLYSLATFGFRGEALSSLCAIGDLSIETRTKYESVGTHLIYDHSGSVKSERKIARQIGTTVTVEKLFSTLPVRSKEFNRNIRREYGKLISLLNAYAIMAKGVRLLCTNISGKNTKSLVLKTQGSSSIKDNIITVFGIKTFKCLEPFSLCISDTCKVEGYLSKPGNGCGRNLVDRQYYYVNGRPVDMPKVSKVVNELYRNSNSKQYPIAIINFIVPTKSYDVNVTPDKRKIFFSDEGTLVLSLREAIEKIYSPNQRSYSINGVKKVNEETYECDIDDADENLTLTRYDSLCEVKKVVNGDEISPSKDLFVNAPLEQHGSFSTCRYKASTSFYTPKSITDSRSPIQSLDILPSKDSPSNSKFVQSSLTKFVTLNKRKHENGSDVLSEMPVLRSETPSCKISKTCKETHGLVSRSISSEISRDYVPKATAESLAGVSCGQENAFSEGHQVDREDIDKGNLEVPETSLTDDTKLVGLSGEVHGTSSIEPPRSCSLMEPCDVLALKPCSANKTYSTYQFNIEDIRKRKKMISSYLQFDSTYNGTNIQRRYNAATLENSQPENDEGKSQALAAATRELERFFRKEDFGRMQVVGQFNLGFIIGKLSEDLFVVDQHAADEKHNFEQLSDSTVLHVQPLLQPVRLELSPEEEVMVSLHMEIIRKNGFALTEDMLAPPGQRYLLKAVPFSKKITFGVEDLKDLISTLSDSQGECSIVSSYRSNTCDSLCPSKVRAMLASRACQASVMVGDALAKNEMQNILRNLAGLKSPWNCPHGRPTMRHLVDLSTLKHQSNLVE